MVQVKWTDALGVLRTLGTRSGWPVVSFSWRFLEALRFTECWWPPILKTSVDPGKGEWVGRPTSAQQTLVTITLLGGVAMVQEERKGKWCDGWEFAGLTFKERHPCRILIFAIILKGCPLFVTRFKMECLQKQNALSPSLSMTNGEVERETQALLTRIPIHHGTPKLATPAWGSGAWIFCCNDRLTGEWNCFVLQTHSFGDLFEDVSVVTAGFYSAGWYFSGFVAVSIPTCQVLLAGAES